MGRGEGQEAEEAMQEEAAEEEAGAAAAPMRRGRCTPIPRVTVRHLVLRPLKRAAAVVAAAAAEEEETAAAAAGRTDSGWRQSEQTATRRWLSPR